MTRKLTTAEIYWDTQDSKNEGWAWRVAFDAGDNHESGFWYWPVDPASGGVADAVVHLAHQHGEVITAADVAVDGLHGIWADEK